MNVDDMSVERVNEAILLHLGWCKRKDLEGHEPGVERWYSPSGWKTTPPNFCVSWDAAGMLIDNMRESYTERNAIGAKWANLWTLTPNEVARVWLKARQK